MSEKGREREREGAKSAARERAVVWPGKAIVMIGAYNQILLENR